MKKLLAFVLAVFLLSKCEKQAKAPVATSLVKTIAMLPVKSAALAETPLEVPVLCYHNFAPATNTDLTLSYKRFAEHIRSLADSGYTSILPEDLYCYLANGEPLPPKPVIISFDDGRHAQYSMAAPLLERFGYRGVFFIMTVAVNKPNYLSCTMLNDLADRGHAIGVHTYDHQMMSHIYGAQWFTQLKEPKIFLENAIHNPVDWFAYPFGPWTERSISELRKDGYRLAFQLDGKPSTRDPFFTVRRLLVDGQWDAAMLHRKIKSTFNRPPSASV